MGGGIPKQFRNLCGRPVLWWSMKAFKDENPATDIILVLPENFISLWNDLFSSLPQCDRFHHRVAKGGSSRSQSVKNGLDMISDEDSLVAVHDGARPLVNTRIIAEGWGLAEKKGAAIPAVPLTDSIRFLEGAGSKSVDRNSYVAVQTPQVFNASLLKKAYNKAGEASFTDDAAVVENAGHSVALFEGSRENIKVTNPLDMDIATLLLDKDS